MTVVTGCTRLLPIKREVDLKIESTFSPRSHLVLVCGDIYEEGYRDINCVKLIGSQPFGWTCAVNLFWQMNQQE